MPTRIPTALIALAAAALAACGQGAPARPEPGATRSTLIMAPGWIAGSGWPAQTVVALSSLHFQQNSVVDGDVAVITSHAGPYLSHGEEAVIGSGVEVRGHVAADSLRLMQGAYVQGGASYNTLIDNGAIDGAITTPLSLPLSITVPAIADFEAGTTDVELPGSATQTLAAGSFGAVLLRAGTVVNKTVLTLSGGVYQLASLDLNDHSRVECAAACEIRIKGRLAPGSRTYIGPSGSSGLPIAEVQVIVEGGNGGTGGANATPFAAVIGQSSELKASIFVPNGTLHLRSDSSSAGKFVARDVNLGSGADLQDGSGVVALPDSWVTGPRWPDQVVTALNSLDLNSGAHVTGDLAVIRAATGPTLASGFEAHIGSNAVLAGNLSADTVMLRSGAQVTGSVSHNGLTNNGTIGGSALTPLDLPLEVTVPAFPAFMAGTTLVDVPARADQTLDAGAYGLVRLRAGVASDKTVLTLTGGVYEIADLDLGGHGRLECAAACEIRVKNRIAPGSDSAVGPAAGSGLHTGDVRIFVDGKNGGGGGPNATPYAAVFGQDNTLRAMVFVPGGTLHVRSGSSVVGRFAAKDVLIGDGSSVELGGLTITQHPGDLVLLEREEATFTCAASGQSVQYRWQKNGEDIPGATAASYTIASVALADSGAYRCIASNALDSAASAEATLTVQMRPPEITQHPQDVTVAEGQPFSLTCVADGTDVTFEWEHGMLPLAGATEATYSVEQAEHDDAGSYLCLATNAAGSVYSDAATVVVLLDPPVITLHPQSATASPGESVTFACAADGTAVGYRWQKDQQDIPGADDQTFAIASVTSGDAGAYRCIASNSGGSAASNEATLSIGSQLPVITQQPPETVSVAEGETFTLTVHANGALGYQWQRNGENVEGATLATYQKQAVLSDDGAQYRVIVANATGSVTSQTATIALHDDVDPTLTIGSPPAITITDDTFVITGTAGDNTSGPIQTTITSDRFPGQEFEVLVNPDGSFEGELPLGLGENQVTITVTDSQGNTSSQTVAINVEATAIPRVGITSPAAGTAVAAERIDVAGFVRSSLPADQIRLRLGNQVRFPTGTGGDYVFAFDDTPLALGANVLRVDAETVYGTVSDEVAVTRLAAPPPEVQAPPPVIELAVAQPRVFVSTPFVDVQGIVRAQTCIEAVTVNGAAANVTGAGTTVSFDRRVDFPAGEGELAIVVTARDCNDRTAEARFAAVRDDGEPVITVAGLSAAGVNTVQQTPYRITGTVSDDNLAGLTANDQSLAALPAGEGQWSFAIDVTPSRTADLPVTFEAWDFAGQRATRTVVLRLDAVRDIAVLVPASGVVIPVSGASVNLEVTARVVGLEPGDRVLAAFDGSPELPLAIAGEYATAHLNVPAQTGPHEIEVSARSQSGALLASSASQFEFQNEADVPVEVARQDPPPDSQHVEANVPIHLFFNRAVDPARLQVKVLETVHGRIYGTQPEGSDLTAQSAVETVEVHRELAPVPGAAQNFPGNATFAFYPSRDYGYGGVVFTEVLLDGNTIWRAQFRVRSLPTLVHGFVSNHVSNPLAGIDVELTDLGRRAASNDDGSWSFGFGEAPDRMLASGRYRAVINPNRKNPRYGSVETILDVAAGELNYQGVTRIPFLNTAEPFRRIESGQTSAAILASGDLVLDLADAVVTFPDGLPEGDVHAQFLPGNELGYRCLESALPDWAFVLQPIAVRVEGDVGISVTLPTLDGSYDYLGSVPDLVLIVGVDQESLLIAPAGVGRIDRDNGRLVSEGPVALERLDVIGISSAVAGLRQGALDAFVAGELTLQALTAALESTP